MSTCEAPNCDKAATLCCPVCAKIGIVSKFCTQECFKGIFFILLFFFLKIMVFFLGFYKNHKLIHTLINSAGQNTSSSEYNPYPNFVYTGKLRPFPLSAKRPVPASIRRPDYADHPNGKSASEEKERGKLSD